ncbi:MFS transporter [Planctomonas sp. JC2975]|uniref:MFS transporter n=1 Tax=Planctomonas sp. JC2975 TaxID=2729626 RepID=UPI001474B041|nr:MFS transporter [Planctomonas sp. JC2975]NNC13517.1 MFS transporter [Planctomonas sp. JC2975]
MTVIEQSYRGSTIRLLVLMLGLFAVGTNAFVIAGLLPQIAAGLGASQASVSYSITVYALIVAVASPVVAFALSRVPRGLLMASGALLFTAGVVIAALSTSLTDFVIARVIAAVGGAALVPTASAVAATIVPPERRGRALAMVGAGFTLAVAIGSPFGTALGSAAGWRAPMWALAVIGAVTTVLILPLFRGVQRAASISLARRLRVLADVRVLAALGAALFATASFNVVYIFSAEVVRDATAGSGALLAVLLLVYGVAGVIGNAFAGRVTDRYGSGVTATIALIVQTIALVALACFEWSFAASVAVFAVWGVVVAGLTIPVQHRLVSIDPQSAQQTMAWYSTAMYLGIAIAPPLGNASLGVAGPLLVPITGAVVSLIALALFLLGFLKRRMPVVSAPDTRDLAVPRA